MQLGVRYGERSVTRVLNPSVTAEKPQSVPAGTVERDQNLEEIEDVGALDESDRGSWGVGTSGSTRIRA
jgi:hypothetical protein